MRLRRFRISGFRCLHDTGEVAVKDLAVLIGKNESGKTAILSALQHLNADQPVDWIDVCDELQTEMDDTSIVVEGWFEIDQYDRELFETEASDLPVPKEVHLTRRVGPQALTYSFPGLKFDGEEHTGDSSTFAIDTFTEKLSALSELIDVDTPPADQPSQAQHTKGKEAAHALIENLSNVNEDNYGTYRSCLRRLKTPLSQLTDRRGAERLRRSLAQCFPKPNTRSSLRDRLQTFVSGRLQPRFVYFSDYKKIEGMIDLDTYAASDKAPRQRLDAGYALDQRVTVDNLFYLSGLDLQRLRAVEKDPQRRIQMLRVASGKLTKLLQQTWLTQRVEIEFELSDDLLVIKVADLHPDGSRSNVGPLRRRAEGFKWHFSFLVNFLAETRRSSLKEAILLLDEPGMHLHAAQQEKFVELIRDLAKRNQTIYTTHSPFMILSYDVGELLIVQLDADTHLSRIESHFWRSDAQSILPVLHSIGGRILAELGGRTRSSPILVVEGTTDYRFLLAARDALSGGERTALDTLGFYPANGSPGIPPAAMYHHSRRYNVAALFDNEPDAKAEAEKLCAVPEFPEARVFLVRVGEKPECDIEDLFTTRDYLSAVNEYYESLLKGVSFRCISAEDVKVAAKACGSSRVVKCLVHIFGEHKADQWGSYDKSAVCDLLCERLTTDRKKFEKATLDRFRRLFDTVIQGFDESCVSESVSGRARILAESVEA